MKTLRFPFSILCVLLISALSAHAAQLATAKVLKVEGTVTKYAANGTQSPLKAGEILKQGDSLSATALSSAKLVFSNGSEVTVKENTRLNIAKIEQASFGGGQSYEQLQADPSKSQTLLELNYGELGFHVKKLQSGSSFNIETPLGTAAIRGTQGTTQLYYNAEREEFILIVNNFDGQIDLVSDYFIEGGSNTTGTSTIPIGESAIVRLHRSAPGFDELFDLMVNYIPTDPKPGWVPLPAPEITPEDPGVIVVSPEDQLPLPKARTAE